MTAKKQEETVKVSKGVKETLEALDALKLVVPAAIEMGKTFKLKSVRPILAAMIPLVGRVVKDYKVVLDGFSGIKEIPSEVGDLEVEELALVGAKALEMVKLARAAWSGEASDEQQELLAPAKA